MSFADRSTTKPLTGTFFYILLAVADRHRYGLGIVQEVERRTDGEVRLGPGTLYNAIKKMLATGLINEVDAPADESDPRRRYYGITPRGQTVLSDEAERLDRLVRAAKAKHVIPARR